MGKKTPIKPALPPKVNFLSVEDKTISSLPIFVTRATERPKGTTLTKPKKVTTDS